MPAIPVRIESIDSSGAPPSDALVERINVLDNELWSESDPDEPPYPVGLTRMRLALKKLADTLGHEEPV